MIVLLRRQMGFCSIVAAQSLSHLVFLLLGYFSSFPKKPTSERKQYPEAERIYIALDNWPVPFHG